MRSHHVRVHPSAEELPREGELAWRIAEVAADPVPLEAVVLETVIDRIIDDAAVSVASLRRRPVASARRQAVARPATPGATVVGLDRDRRSSPEWAAWANGVAVRELDFHDTFLAADYSHPGDNIPPVLAVAQHCGLSGRDLARGIATGYEIQVDLVRGICLHAHRIDHIAHLGPSAAAGIGTALGLPVEVIHQAVGQALHVTTTTRQSRKGAISSWKAYAPAFAGKMAVEAVDRAMRGEGAPAPVYEGEDGVIAWLLGGPEAVYEVPLPEPGEPKRAILDTYTKEHSAEYQAQALIDLARRVSPRIGDQSRVREVVIHTSHHTHNVIGTGAGDPQKMDPEASRETLDHSIMYIVAVALQDREWHHERSYAPARARRPDTVALWRKCPHRRGSRLDAPVPRARPGRPRLRRPAGGDARRRDRDRGRAGRGRRPPARRAAVRPRAVRGEVPQPRRRGGGAGRAGPLPGVRARPGRAGGPRAGRPDRHGRPRSAGARHAARDLRPMSRAALSTSRPSPSERRAALRDALASGRLLRFPGAFSPLVAMAVEDAGFEGVYVSGAALSADLGLPDVGLTTLSEVAGRGGADRAGHGAPRPDRRRHRVRRGDERGPHRSRPWRTPAWPGATWRTRSTPSAAATWTTRPWSRPRSWSSASGRRSRRAGTRAS